MLDDEEFMGLPFQGPAGRKQYLDALEAAYGSELRAGNAAARLLLGELAKSHGGAPGTDLSKDCCRSCRKPINCCFSRKCSKRRVCWRTRLWKRVGRGGGDCGYGFESVARAIVERLSRSTGQDVSYGHCDILKGL
jgi:hypothetical protein